MVADLCMNHPRLKMTAFICNHHDNVKPSVILWGPEEASCISRDPKTLLEPEACSSFTFLSVCLVSRCALKHHFPGCSEWCLISSSSTNYH